MKEITKQQIIDRIYQRLDKAPKKAIGVSEIQEIDNLLIALSPHLSIQALQGILSSLSNHNEIEPAIYRAMEIAYKRLTPKQQEACLSDNRLENVLSHLRIQAATNQLMYQTNQQKPNAKFNQIKFKLINEIYQSMLDAPESELGIDELEAVSEFLHATVDYINIDIFNSLLSRAKYQSVLPETVYHSLQQAYSQLSFEEKQQLCPVGPRPIAIDLLKIHFSKRRLTHLFASTSLEKSLEKDSLS